MAEDTHRNSALTVAGLHRELEQFKELIESRIAGEVYRIVARLDAMDKALTKVEQYPTDVDKAFLKLKELHEQRMDYQDAMYKEKLKNIHELFNERDKRSGFLADSQKEAREKSEASLSHQLSSLEAQIATVSRVLDGKLDDLKTRIQIIEGRM